MLRKRLQSNHLYRGHRRGSFYPIDASELVELRARDRTFNGAYARSALGNLGYSVVILKLFDQRFYYIGLLYVILAGFLFLLSILRRRHSRHDFSDRYGVVAGRWDGDTIEGEVAQSRARDSSVDSTCRRIYGRPFVTAGWIVVAVSLVVAAVEVGLLVLILNLDQY
ncbi:hypothetical protein BOTBODRAFT_64758 [Botryobasidium botryosum FD-172 SS1]|uniref:DUF202 domain-containing protein n=1 Tax=Botryobasidium botryosum (strain FD-172 SS1) TaxID=930990 RepID=A0A067MY19_BOTB1|nr:hypothetical protein BOTBODRAFT_64758 [Botryobasidium botryosum FD-172 SS1]